jgi:hypothetical protein
LKKLGKMDNNHFHPELQNNITTKHLINKNKQVDAYEIDPRMKEYLDGNLNSDNLSVILEDFLKPLFLYFLSILKLRLFYFFSL